MHDRASFNPMRPDATSISELYLISDHPNSTLDLYITPRLSPLAQQKLIYVPHRGQKQKDLKTPLANSMVLINRYVNGRIMKWLQRHRSQFTSVIWLIDDDLKAMMSDRSIPLLKKARPFLTLWHYQKLKGHSNLLLTSTDTLANKIDADTKIIIPPIVDLRKQTERPINPKHLLYFAKMHSHEHTFLFPIIEDLLTRHADCRFSVIANGNWKQRWQALDRVTVYPEMTYLSYQSFLASQPEGGLFLVPLLPTKLNKSRSSAKLIDVALSGSAPLLSDHPAYADFVEIAELTTAGKSVEEWICRIEGMFDKPLQVQESSQRLRQALQAQFDQRQMII